MSGLGKFSGSFDSWQCVHVGRFACGKRISPLPDSRAEGFQMDPPVAVWELFQLDQTLAEQRLRAQSVATRVMVKRRGRLDHPLKKSLVRFGGREPDFLPRFMSLEKPAMVELFYSAGELLSFVSWVHRQCRDALLAHCGPGFA